jgi:hypothetical protein
MVFNIILVQKNEEFKKNFLLAKLSCEYATMVTMIF